MCHRGRYHSWLRSHCYVPYWPLDHGCRCRTPSGADSSVSVRDCPTHASRPTSWASREHLIALWPAQCSLSSTRGSLYASGMRLSTGSGTGSSSCRTRQSSGASHSPLAAYPISSLLPFAQRYLNSPDGSYNLVATTWHSLSARDFTTTRQTLDPIFGKASTPRCLNSTNSMPNRPRGGCRLSKYRTTANVPRRILHHVLRAMLGHACHHQ